MTTIDLGPFTNVTPANYVELAQTVIRAGAGVVLTWPGEGDHKPQQWRAWMAYFAWLDRLTAPPGHRATAWGALRHITVPAEWPLEFDDNAPPSPLPDQPPPPTGIVRRRELGNLLRRVVDVGPEVSRRAAPDARDPRQPSLKLEEGVDAFADRGPVALGPALKTQLGKSIPESPQPEDCEPDW